MRNLLGIHAPLAEKASTKELLEQIMGHDVSICPNCGKGKLTKRNISLESFECLEEHLPIVTVKTA